MEVLLISNDLLGTSGRPVWSKSVCIWLPVSKGWFLRQYLMFSRRDRDKRNAHLLLGQSSLVLYAAVWCYFPQQWKERESTLRTAAKKWTGKGNLSISHWVDPFKGSPVGLFKEQRTSPSDSDMGDSFTDDSFSVILPLQHSLLL